MVSDFFIHLEKNVAIGYWANGELTPNQSEQIFQKLLETAITIGAIDNEYSPSNNPKECSTTVTADDLPSQSDDLPPQSDASLQFCSVMAVWHFSLLTFIWLII